MKMAEHDRISIAFCTSEEYLDLVQTALWSILMHRELGRSYKVYILCRNMPEEQKMRFCRELAVWNGVELVFMDVSALVCRYVPGTQDAVKITLFSLLLPELLPAEERIIALDCDLIARRGLGELFDIDIGDAFLAAALDPDFIGQYNGGNPYYRRYYRDVVPLARPYEYFQGGVYVLNLEKLRESFPPGKLFAEAAVTRYRYDDQDILNLYCAGHVKVLDMRWNVLYDSLGYRRKYVIDLAPSHIRQMYDEARKDPWIVHYAGGERPWNDENCDFATVFWAAADKTPAGVRLRERMVVYRQNLRENPLYRLVRNTGLYMRYVVRKAHIKMRKR